MMDTQAALAIVAEIGIGVAGFSGIAMAVLTRSVRELVETRWVELRTLLVTSLAIVLLAYLPMLLGAGSLSDTVTWTIASGVYGAWVLFSVAVFFGGFRRLAGVSGHTRRTALVTFGLACTSLVLSVLNVAALQTGWPYLAALACGMLVTFIQFVSLVRSLWESVDGRPA